MNFNKWKDHKGYTLGAELEARLQDSETFKLKEYSSKLRERFSDEYKKKIHQEFLECMVEFVTPVCNDSYEVVKELKEQIAYINSLAKEDSTVVATSGSCSLRVDPLKHVDEERYDAFAKEYGILLSRFHICGFHIHVALPSSDEALQAYNFSLEYLPIFLALSANSPFFNGEDAGLLSYRAKIFEQLPRAGLSSYFESFEEMKKLYMDMNRAGTINSIKDIWWDIRVSPNFGTLEIRICDASSDFERLRLLVVLYQALVLFAQGKEIYKIPHQILLQNRWTALRHGLDGVFQNSKKVTTIRDHYIDLLERMEREGVFEKLGTTSDIKKLKELAFEDEPAKQQLKVFKETNSLIEVEKLGRMDEIK